MHHIKIIAIFCLICAAYIVYVVYLSIKRPSEMDHAIIYKRGQLSIKQIKTGKKKLVIKNRNADGKFIFRDPVIGDMLENHSYIIFIGTYNQCKKQLKQSTKDCKSNYQP